MRLALVHGFTQTGRSWLPLVPALERAGHEVVCPDVPGHGTASGVALDLVAGARYLAEAVGTATWIGYSMGGRLSLQLALDHPASVEALVLISTSAGIDDDHERALRRAADDALADEIESGEVAPFIDRWLAGPLWATLPRDRAGVTERLANTPAGLASHLRLMGTGTQASLWDRLGTLDTPTLIVTGDQDAKFTALGDRMADRVGARARRCSIRGAGHALPWEQPDAFIHALLEFLLTVPRAPNPR